MSQIAFYLDMTRCVGCRTCQVACKDKNRIMVPGTLFRHVESWETGTFPDAHVYHTSTSCNHCENPLCVASCPQGALYKDDDGAVVLDGDACIGCQACVEACPYGACHYFEEENLVHKCDTCKVLREAGGNPACVDSCPMRALDFGDAEEIKQKYGDGLVTALPAWPDGGTSPQTYFKVNDRVMEENPRWVLI